MKNKSLNKYEQGGLILKKKTKDNYGKKENANAGYSTAGPGWIGEGTTNRGFNYNGAWGGTMQMGGSLPGAVGFTYARTAGSAPANGKYTKKTKASAQNGQEMKYYQEGLDFKPKTISKNGKKLSKAAMGKAMVNKQLHQLTEWEGVPKYYNGGPLDTSIISSYQPVGMPNMSALSGKLSDPGFQQQAIQQVESIQPKGGFDAAGAGMAALGAVPGIIAGVEAIGAQKKAKKKAEQATQLSGLALQAQQTAEKAKRKYVRPEDMILQPGQMGNPYGSGTNFLAKNGTMIGGNPTEIQNIYNPGDIYTDGGYEPLESQKLKQYKQGGNLPEAEFGEYFQDSGQAQIGSAVGTAAGTLIGGPLGGLVGGLVGTAAGNLLGGAKQARKLQAEKDKTSMNTQQAAFTQAQQNQFGAYMEQGGKVDVGDEYKWVSHTWQPQTITKFGEYNVKDLLKPPHDADMLRSGGHLKDEYYTPPSAAAMFTGRPELKPLTMEHGGKFAMGGDLEVIEGGKAETISYNPFLPDGGETVMFKGRSHDNGGIPINFGENGVEVEGGEPAVKLQNGGEENNMVVFGNMKLSKMAADEFGIPDAKGKKFKHVANEISKVEKKQNKLIDQATERADMTTGSSGFDQLKMNTSEAQLMGANMKLRNAAILKQNLGAVQNAILDTASELGVKSDELAQGKLVKEKDPRMMAQDGIGLTGGPLTPAQRAKAQGPGGTLYEGAKHYVTERGQLPLFARMLGAKPKPRFFNEELNNTLMNADDRSYMVDKPYNEDLTNQLMSGARNYASFNPDFNSAMMYGTPYNQPAPVAASAASSDTSTLGFTPIPETFGDTGSQASTQPSAQGSSKVSNSKSAKSNKSNPTNTSSVVRNQYITDYNLPSGFTPGVSNLPEGMGGLKYNVMESIQQAIPKLPGSNTKVPYQPGYVAPKPTSDKLSTTANLSTVSEDSEKAGFDWKGLGQMALSNLTPLLRPRTNIGLDPEELYPEYYAMATNQLEPVQAQTFQPMLDTPMDISLNDQLNAIDAQSRAAIRAAGSNPAAQAMIMSQSLEAKNKVLGEQTRINAANKMQTYDKNRALLNDAQLKNLQILDQQYVRQAQAKSNTKAQTLEALKSISAKTAQNKLENQTLNVYENMYNYRFSPSGRAFNVNAPAQFNLPEGISADNLTGAQANQIKELYEKIVSRDKTGAITGSKEKTRTTKQNRNGAIVQALKNL
jgi:hypothetical protein